ncbi:hypothetical protein PREVCOP_06643 [Segatella copri DSM 18205]|uniref:Uncharacterized protein n=1 Tax=Segatella copri DSM 18205 TaxID=537011 RepID=D1PHC3_9BACT|nr:hypothetical protein PREVCOP_06643 [Segatella copri DSM 18205]
MKMWRIVIISKHGNDNLYYFLAKIKKNIECSKSFYYFCIAFPKKVEDFFILGVIDFRKACI